LRQAIAHLFGPEAIRAARQAYQRGVSLFGEPQRFDKGFTRVLCRKTGSDNEATPIYLDHLIEAKSGQAIFEVAIGGRLRPLIVSSDEGPCALADLHKLIEDHLDERYNPPCRPATTLLPFNYRRVPAWARLVIHHGLVWQRRIRYPRIKEGLWPLWDIQRLFSQLMECLGVGKLRADKENLCVITHDVDGAEQLPFAQKIAEVEKDAGIFSTFYLPAILLRDQADKVQKIADLGHEIGLHGLVHDCRHLMIDPADYVARIHEYMPEIRRFGIKGYRAPALLTNSRLRRELASIFSYDSSIPDTDIFAEAGLHRGCGMLEPYPESGLKVLPVTLPLDDRLLTLGYEDTVAFWMEKVQAIFDRGGLPVLCTHANEQYYRSGHRSFFKRLEGARARLPAHKIIKACDAVDFQTLGSKPDIVLSR